MNKKPFIFVLLLLVLAITAAAIVVQARRKGCDQIEKPADLKTDDDDNDPDDEEATDPALVMTNPKAFAGFKISANLRPICRRRGYRKVARCWANSCGATRRCYKSPVTCICIEGFTGERCQFRLTTSAAPADATTVPETTTTALETVADTPAPTTATDPPTPAPDVTTATLPAAEVTTQPAQDNITCSMLICNETENKELFPGYCYDARSTKRMERCGVESATEAPPTTEPTTEAAAAPTTEATTATTEEAVPPGAETIPGDEVPTPAPAPPDTSRLGMPLIEYFQPDRQRTIKSFVTKSREQLFATMPLQFGLERNGAATYLANVAQFILDKISGSMTVTTQFNVLLAKATIPAAKAGNDPAFNAAVDALPATFDEASRDAYLGFVNQFGTHYVEYVLLGCRAQRSTGKSYCKESEASALESEENKMQKIVFSNDKETAASYLDTVVGGPGREVISTSGITAWADRCTIDNAAHIELGLKNISTRIADPEKRAGVDMAVDILMPTEDPVTGFDWLECQDVGLIVGLTVGLVCGVILLAIVAYCVYIKCYQTSVNASRGDGVKTESSNQPAAGANNV
jgi:hypothetical protein